MFKNIVIVLLVAKILSASKANQINNSAALENASTISPEAGDNYDVIDGFTNALQNAVRVYY